MVENREVSQTATGGQTGTSGVLLNAQLSLAEDEGWGVGRHPLPPRHRQVHTSQPLTSLFISSKICKQQQQQGGNPPSSLGKGLTTHAAAFRTQPAPQAPLL